ncbi:hypothetical protein [Nocardia sp. NBC_00403]|uniref:hypothetical protein n=1 Tax=Nocardia sp. NBC_00403 TaxID=2975990 RepID=UPI002E1D2102
MNWRRWMHAHPPQMTTISGCTDSRSHPPEARLGAVDEGRVRLHADCGRVKFDGENRLISVACPAVFCGSVSVSDDRIGAHRTWDARPCGWGGALIVDDTATVRAVS